MSEIQKDKRAILIIDGSYYVFYRYHALKQWWKHAKKDDILENPWEREEFVEKFKKMCVVKIQEIVKKLKLENPMIIVAKDCVQSDIWRVELFPEYKKGRVVDQHVGGAFKCVFDNELFKKGGAHILICHPKLEADDCVALTIQNVRRLAPEKRIYIITSDMDYLQIADENTIPINLQMKPLRESKQSFKNSEKDLFCKILTGDKSDNIPSVFKKCGIKTAEKYFNDKELFHKKLEEDPLFREQYELNKQIIDFKSIPLKYIKEFNTGEYTVKWFQ